MLPVGVCISDFRTAPGKTSGSAKTKIWLNYRKQADEIRSLSYDLLKATLNSWCLIDSGPSLCLNINVICCHFNNQLYYTESAPHCIIHSVQIWLCLLKCRFMQISVMIPRDNYKVKALSLSQEGTVWWDNTVATHNATLLYFTGLRTVMIELAGVSLVLLYNGQR